MNRVKVVFGLGLIFSVCFTHAQRTLNTGLLPGVSVARSLTEFWRVNLRVENRQLFFEKSKDGTEQFTYELLLTDLIFQVSRKTGINNSLTGGYLIRFTDQHTIHRLFQHFNFISSISHLKLAQRFAAEEFFSIAYTPRLRLRYRILLEAPLQGQLIDPGEFYLKLGSEYLEYLGKNDLPTEVRLISAAGLMLTMNHRLEVGLDYRALSPWNNTGQDAFWVTINWFIIIPSNNQTGGKN